MCSTVSQELVEIINGCSAQDGKHFDKHTAEREDVRGLVTVSRKLDLRSAVSLGHALDSSTRRAFIPTRPVFRNPKITDENATFVKQNVCWLDVVVSYFLLV